MYATQDLTIPILDKFMYREDSPHVEGGRNPMERFEKATKNLSGSDQDKFFRSNFEDLMGSAF